jgi:hypothetical protein
MRWVMQLLILVVLVFLVLVLPFRLFMWWKEEQHDLEETFSIVGVDLLYTDMGITDQQ